MTGFNGNTAAYDPFGELRTISGTTRGVTSATPFAASMTYDYLGRRTSFTESLSSDRQGASSRRAPPQTSLSDTLSGLLVREGYEMVYREFSGSGYSALNQPDLPSGTLMDNGVLYLYGPTGLVMEFNRYTSSSLLFDPEGSCVSSTTGVAAGQSFTAGVNYGFTIYDGYGEPVWTPNAWQGISAPLNQTTAQPFQYKGQFGYNTDGTSGLAYCIHRFYAPLTGRWTERDPS